MQAAATPVYATRPGRAVYDSARNPATQSALLRKTTGATLMNRILDRFSPSRFSPNRFSPSITTMIRTDHTHAMAAFHRFRADLSFQRKDAIVRHVCLALEIHAQLEEEIFYPALRQVLPDNEELQKSAQEHGEMKELIAQLKDEDPSSDTFDEIFHKLMRAVMHHVADEESVLLPAAEELLADELSTLGRQMTQRRIELLAPHSGEAAVTGMQTFPVGAAALAVGGLALVAALAVKGSNTRRHRAW
jgi:hemerythrin-like domain-containing protein